MNYITKLFMFFLCYLFLLIFYLHIKVTSYFLYGPGFTINARQIPLEKASHTQPYEHLGSAAWTGALCLHGLGAAPSARFAFPTFRNARWASGMAGPVMVCRYSSGLRRSSGPPLASDHHCRPASKNLCASLVLSALILLAVHALKHIGWS